MLGIGSSLYNFKLLSLSLPRDTHKRKKGKQKTSLSETSNSQGLQKIRVKGGRDQE